MAINNFKIVLLFVVLGHANSQTNGSEIDSSEGHSATTLQFKSAVVYENVGSKTVEITADNWTPPDVSPLFQAFKNFLFQERVAQRSLPDESPHITYLAPEVAETSETSEPLSPTTADKVIEMINNNLQDAISTTISTIAEEIEAVTLRDSAIQSTEASVESQSEAAPMWDLFGFKPLSKKKTPQNLINLTKSCSSCFVKLSTCVNQCFAQSDCRNVERSARTCPVVAASFCNPFTPWSPVDQCQADSDCESPLLCCNDGCVKKCSLGVWKN